MMGTAVLLQAALSLVGCSEKGRMSVEAGAAATASRALPGALEEEPFCAGRAMLSLVEDTAFAHDLQSTDYNPWISGEDGDGDEWTQREVLSLVLYVSEGGWFANLSEERVMPWAKCGGEGLLSGPAIELDDGFAVLLSPAVGCEFLEGRQDATPSSLSRPSFAIVTGSESTEGLALHYCGQSVPMAVGLGPMLRYRRWESERLEALVPKAESISECRLAFADQACDQSEMVAVCGSRDRATGYDHKRVPRRVVAKSDCELSDLSFLTWPPVVVLGEQRVLPANGKSSGLPRGRQVVPIEAR